MSILDNSGDSRRQFLIRSAACLGFAALGSPAALLAATSKEAMAEEVTPTEDLMREHGVLRRLMLIFDGIGGRLQGSAAFPPDPLIHATKLIRRFIQDYHEKDEEEFLFPRFEKAGKLVHLVKILREQHEAGRKLIADLQGRATAANQGTMAGREKIRGLLNAFSRMYRPHAAWEDTVLYPAFRSVITPAEFDALGDAFENREQQLFGKDGFEKIVAEVAGVEQELGHFELELFTPKV
jgi:hemerythrin-like domain-containing protein